METINQIEAFRSALNWRRNKRTVGLVVSMGNLHDGQVAMIKACRKKADIVVVAVYVNPLRFSDDQSFSDYPRTPQADEKLLESLNVDFRFAPKDPESTAHNQVSPQLIPAKAPDEKGTGVLHDLASAHT